MRGLQAVWKMTFGRLIRRARHRRLQKLRVLQPLGLRPSSAPFLSGDTFRRLCDVSWGDPADASFDPAALQPGALVFCCSHRLEDFLGDVATAITVPFVLVSGNSDRNVEPADFSLPSTVTRWYAQNLLAASPRVEPLPIGLENRHYWNHGDPEDFSRLRTQGVPQRNAIYFGFNPATNPQEREPLLKLARASSLCVTIAGLDSWEYRRAMRRFRFVLSPAGNGVDCHRTWEALYLNVVPILKRTPFAELLYSMGFPLLILNDWDALTDLTEAELERVYDREKTKFANEKLWLDYWKNEFQQAERKGR